MGLSWEATIHSATQAIPNILCTQEVQYCVHKTLPMTSILSQIYPVHITQYYF
jgi:glutamate/tyrosine decarboxylase-like PLP-dependent enzyme